MKNILLIIMLLLPMAVLANDQSIMLEIGVGFGSSGIQSTKNDNARWCKNRNTGGLTFVALRYRNDNTELHTARWFHDEDVTTCNRDSWAVGAGYVLSTEGAGTIGQKNLYATWTPGLAYTWGENRNFTGQDADNTNWRNTGNWQVFNRVALGRGTDDIGVEIAINRYGTFNEEHGETFATVGFIVKDLENNNPTLTNKPVKPPVKPPVDNSGVGQNNGSPQGNDSSGDNPNPNASKK
jgi:hypothetical protein